MQFLKRSCLPIRLLWKKKHLTSETVSGLCLLLTLTVLVIYPLIMLVLNSVGISVNNFSFNLKDYFKLFFDQQFLGALVNTLYLALTVSILSSLIGGGLAWLVTRTDLSGKGIIDFLVFLTFIIPSFIMAVSFIELFGKNGIVTNLFLETWKANTFPLEIYSLGGVILVMTINLYPLVYMTLSNALKNSDNSIEEAAYLDGAGRLKVLFSITIPMIMPNLLAVGLLVFARTVACFGVAALLALPAREYILTTYIYTALSSLMLSQATTVSVILILLTGTIFLIQSSFLKNRDYITLSSNSSRPAELSLGRAKKPVIGIIFCFFFITTILPLIVILLTSFLKAFGLDYQLSNFTLANYRYIFLEQRLMIRVFRNSIIYGLLSATIALLLGSLAAYLANRSSFRGRKMVEFFASWPMAIPGIVIAVAAILAWINPPLKLYNTPWIIIVSYVTASLPLVVKNVSGLIQNIDQELEETAWILGASYLKTFRWVIIPLIKSGLRTGWILSFLFVLREIPISLMLYASGTETIGVLLFNLRSDSGGLETLSAFAVILLLLTVAGHLLIKGFKRWEKD